MSEDLVGVYAVRLARDVLRASGPEADAYLQGQLSQDVLAVSPGESAWSWVLAPTGKVDALVRVTKMADGDWLLDTDAGWGDPLLGRLQRFKLRTKVDLETAPLSIVGLRGSMHGVDLAGAGTVISPPWPGVEGADIIGESAIPEGIEVIEAARAEVERILSGIPKMGAELDERTIPGETGLVLLTVSFTKGCYTGQELVARIDSRGGNVPRHLRGLRSDAEVPAGEELTAPDGRPAGVVTSSALGPSGEWVGLGYVRRGFDVAETLEAGGARVTQVELSS